MFILETKPKEELEKLLKPGVCVIKCIGCREISLPEEKIEELLKNLELDAKDVLAVDYLCNADFTKSHLLKYKSEIDKCNSILVFSCGVGLQVLAGMLEEKSAVQGLNTIYISGRGLAPSDYDCDQCGECLLNLTGGICPVTQCSKGLLNGPCGGAKNGKCEISKDLDCAWEKIYKKLEASGRLDSYFRKMKVRDYSKALAKPKQPV